MRRVAWFFVFVIAINAMAFPVRADCVWTILDVSYFEYEDNLGNQWGTTTYYWGWWCTDVANGWGTPYPPGVIPPPDSPPPTPAPQPQPQAPAPQNVCSLVDCLQECADHYLRDAGVEVGVTGIVQ